MVMADFKDYRRAQHDLQELYRDKQKWNHMSLKNISNAGIFSADRSIMDYARDIWGATPVEIIWLSDFAVPCSGHGFCAGFPIEGSCHRR